MYLSPVNNNLGKQCEKVNHEYRSVNIVFKWHCKRGGLERQINKVRWYQTQAFDNADGAVSDAAGPSWAGSGRLLYKNLVMHGYWKSGKRRLSVLPLHSGEQAYFSHDIYIWRCYMRAFGNICECKFLIWDLRRKSLSEKQQ